MPDSTIFALGGTGGDAQPDSYVENSLSTIAGGASWAQLVADSTGNNHNDSAASFDEGIHNAKFFGRGTSNTWECNRSFFAFDLSGESGTIASAQFKVYSDNLGDTGTDMKTAVAAGCYPVGVLWGFRSEKELKDSGAQAIIKNPLDVLDLIK